MRKRSDVTYIDKFRWSKAWKEKSIEIKRRDNFLCQICIRKLYSTLQQYNYSDLSVHHAIPIAADWDKRLDNDNLITACDMHHDAMEKGEIPYEVVKEIIDEQEKKVSPGVVE